MLSEFWSRSRGVAHTAEVAKALIHAAPDAIDAATLDVNVDTGHDRKSADNGSYIGIACEVCRHRGRWPRQLCGNAGFCPTRPSGDRAATGVRGLWLAEVGIRAAGHNLTELASREAA